MKGLAAQVGYLRRLEEVSEPAPARIDTAGVVMY